MYSLDRSCFIDNQRLYVLRPSDGRTLSLKQALSLRGLPEYEAVNRPYGKWDRDAEKREFWKTIDNSHGRAKFLKFLGGNADSLPNERRLLCITSSAGIGKSIALEQARFLRSQLPGHVVMYYHLSQFPNSVDSFWGRGSGDATHESVFKRIDKQLSASQSRRTLPKAYYSGIEAWLTRQMSLGQVTLFIDGLDEIDSSNAGPRAAAIKSILEEHPNLHCMVAGRPYAITDTYWNTIFGKESEPGFEDHSSDWTFCCVGLFDQKQIERSLGPTRAKRIQELAGELNLTPRTIEVLRSLPDESFARINNLCDVYWESLPRTFEEDVLKKKKGGVTPNVGGIQIDTFIEYACALAITMFLETKREVQYSDIADDLLTRLRTIPKWQGDSAESLDKRRESIEALNAGAIEFRLFNRIDTMVSWRDNTLRDFFAALWMVRYSNEAELKQLIETIPERPREPDDNEVWEFIASMPVGAMVAGPKSERCMRWLRLAEAVFKQPKKHPRPTQLMWYAWPRLAELTVNNPEINVPAEVPKSAQSIRERFLREFDVLSTASDTAQIIHEDLIFIPIKPLDNGSWNVAVGHPDEEDNQPRKIELEGPYSVSKFPITRRLYQLFDGNHEVHYRDDFVKYCLEQRCPVICMKWYDAQIFAIWCKSRLLNEWEWEYACRANRKDADHQKLNHWRVDPIDDEAREKVAWIEENSQDHTWPVDAKTDPSHTNSFGLVDMLGNVWEWTEGVYKVGRVSRVLRGGSFINDGRYASASYRFHVVPTYSLILIGFRVARAP
jgi:formylglycine-generating enzyme required for sulfatase activity